MKILRYIFAIPIALICTYIFELIVNFNNHTFTNPFTFMLIIIYSYGCIGILSQFIFHYVLWWILPKHQKVFSIVWLCYVLVLAFFSIIIIFVQLMSFKNSNYATMNINWSKIVTMIMEVITNIIIISKFDYFYNKLFSK